MPNSDALADEDVPVCHRCMKREATEQGIRGLVCSLCFEAERAAKDYVASILTPAALDRIFKGERRG